MDSEARTFEEAGSAAERASLELLYHVSREFASALDLRTVLKRVLFLSMKTVKAASGSIIVLDDQGRAVDSAVISGPETIDHTTQRLSFAIERGLAGWVIQQRQAVIIQDTSSDARWAPRGYGSPGSQGAKSVISAPLLVQERLVGVITLANSQPGFFTGDHLSLIQAIADQASIAVLNGRLYAESRRQAAVMTALAESAAAINASLQVKDVLLRILEQIQKVLRVEAVALALLDGSKEHLVFQASIGWNSPRELEARVEVGEGFAGWAVREAQGLVVHDVEQDLRGDKEINQRTGLQVRAAACAPIRSKGAVFGVLEAVNPLDEFFNPDALQVLDGIGSLAGTAIQHAQLFESLEAAHKRYYELFDDSIDPIILTDREGRVLEANRQMAAATGWSRDELRGRLSDQLHIPNLEKLGERYTRLEGSQTISYESSLSALTGDAIPVEVHVRQAEFEGRTFLQWIFRDISERKKLDALREDLLSMIYHDLRSPLANVVTSLYAVSALLPTQEDDTLASLLSIAHRSTKRVERLTSSLLDISRLEAGQSLGKRELFDPAQAIKDAVETVLPVSLAKNQKILTELPDAPPQVSGDADMIRRVLTNLLENAVKFTPPEGTIQTGAKNLGDKIEFYVQDDGPGIPTSDRERIFDKFSRLTAKDSPKGLGLGLTFCRLAVEAHGGRIWVDSENGSGSRFVFTLPSE
jgi:two-component system, NtrC family, sensor histidine kinase KinB